MSINKGVKQGDTVKLVAYEADAVVIDILSSQFTCSTQDKPERVLYFFYQDKGETWTELA